MTRSPVPLISLPEVLDRTTVPGTREAILAVRQGELTLDAGDVRRISALGVEMLLAAQRQWAADGHSLTIAPTSPAFDEALGQLGIAADDLCTAVSE